MDKKRIGAFLKELRKEKGWTQVEFARKFSKSCFGDIGVISDAAVSKWERGESIPNIIDIQHLAQFYNVTIDEILYGEKAVNIDLDKKYFISDQHWFIGIPKGANLYKIREKQELEIEMRFKALLKKMISEGLTYSENVEFDYLLSNFYTICIDDETDDNSIVIKKAKFQIMKTVALMHNSSLDEKFWEVYKLFKSHFPQTIKQDVCNALEDAEDILRERVCELEDFEKDMLLAAIQIENVTNAYGVIDKNLATTKSKLSSLYEKTYNRPYDEDQLTKNAIKLLVECGARLNPLLLGFQREKIIEIDILDRLVELYNKFKKPIIISVYEDQISNFYEVDNTFANRNKLGYNSEDEILDEAEYSDLEQRLYKGECVLEKTVPENCWGDSEEGMRKHMFSVIRDLSLQKYISAREEKLTAKMIKQLDKLSLEDIRKIYFTRRNV